MAPIPSRDLRSIAALKAKALELGLDVRFDEDLSPIWRPVTIGGLRSDNSLAIHPMEGCDATSDGAPGELTTRRYLRYARSGVGLIWFEAVAVVQDGRAAPRQLWLHRQNVGEFASLLEKTSIAGREANGLGYRPIRILQLTHSGRFAKSGRFPAPVIACHQTTLDSIQQIPADYPVVSDDDLDRLQDDFVRAARLAWQAGFEGVDVKACHGFLAAELLKAHRREGRYGGSFENRTRFVRETVDRIRIEAPDLLLAVRMNGHDGVESGYTWGMCPTQPDEIDLAEPIRLAKMLGESGVMLLSVSLGAAPRRTDYPLEPIADHFQTTRRIQEAVPNLVVLGAQYSALRQHFPLAAAANLKNGWTRMVGVGRAACAYPGFARDLKVNGSIDPKRICTACGRCVKLVHAELPIGCVTRDAAVYRALYRQLS